MQLRNTIRAPRRFDEEFGPSDMPRSNLKTTPQYPELLKRQVVPFNPDQRPAAFPTLPLSAIVLRQSTTTNDRVRPPTPSFTETIDSESVGDDQWSDFELRFDQDDRVPWSSLELSVQCRIFASLALYHQPDDVATLLGLTAAEDTRIRHDLLRRKQFSFINQDTFNHSVERTNQDLWVCDFAEAYPISIQRAARFLQERGLAQSLLGEWTLSLDGGGMLICCESQTGSTYLRSAIPDSGYFSGSESVEEVLATSLEGPPRHTLNPRQLPLLTNTNHYGQFLFDHIDPSQQMLQMNLYHCSQPLVGHITPAQLTVPTNACHPRQSLLDPIEPGQLTMQTNTKRQRQPSLDHIKPVDAPQTAEPPMKAPRKSRKSRHPAPIRTRPPPPCPLSTPPVPGSDNGESGSAIRRSAGGITLRNRDKIRATEKRQEMLYNFDWMDRDAEPKDKRPSISSSPSSPFVTLRVTKDPKLRINQKTGLAQVTSSPATVGDHIDYVKIRGRILPDDAAEAIMMTPRSPTISIPPRTPAVKPGRESKRIELMHDSDRFTSTFKHMPKDEQERLLSMHPADRNIVQTWLIYGEEAWNRKLIWNRNFPENCHIEPAQGEQWNVKAAGSILCRSLVVQRNLCQELGLDDKFFQAAHVGEKVIQGYEAILRQRQAIEKVLRRKYLLDFEPSEALCEDKKVSEAEELCRQIEKNLCDELRRTYAKHLPGSVSDMLTDKFPNKVVLFDYEPTEVLRLHSSAQPFVTTPTEPQSRPTENVFTSKALGISLEDGQVHEKVTPDVSGSSTFANEVRERTELTDHFAEDSIFDAAAENALSSSPLIRKHQLNLKAKKAANHRASCVTTANDATPTISRRRLSVACPDFSPISEEDAEQFAIEFDRKKHADKAAALMYQVCQARSAAMPPTRRSSLGLPRDSLIGEREQEQDRNDVVSATRSGAKERTNTTTTEPKRTKIILKLSPPASAQVSTPPTRQNSIVKASGKKTPKRCAKTSSASNTGSRNPTRSIETRAQKAYREDKPSAHTRSRVSTPDLSLDKVGGLKKGGRSSIIKGEKSTSTGKKAVKAINK